MHGLVVVNLALAGLAAHAYAHSVPPPVSPLARRKTLGFGPDLPHARFESVDVHASAVDATKDAYAVARDFLDQYDNIHAGRTYVIRPDSYTDHATGVTHIYARQIIGGIEVANARVNLNIKDGRVLSFGDSVRVLTPRPTLADTDTGIVVLHWRSRPSSCSCAPPRPPLCPAVLCTRPPPLTPRVSRLT